MIVAVGGGKGGVGKSTVALNLAGELDAVAVDADLAAGDLPRGTGPDLYDVLAGRADPVAAVERIGSVRVLPCGRSLAGARAADLDAVAGTATALERHAGRVVLDCPAGTAADVGALLRAADVTTIVTTSAEPARRDARRSRRLSLEVGTPIGAVAVNRLEDPDAATDGFERDFRAPAVAVPEHRAVREAGAAGRPVRDVAPDSSPADRLGALARTLERCDRGATGARR